MVLKFRAECKYPADGKEGEYGKERWNYIDGFILAGIDFDRQHGAIVASLDFEDRDRIVVELPDTAYLLNDNGKIIWKVEG